MRSDTVPSEDHVRNDTIGDGGWGGGRCARHVVRVLGYCLMTNPIHLVGAPAREDSLNLVVGRTHFIYTQSL